MDSKVQLVKYKIFNAFDDVLVFTTTRQTLDIKKVRFSERPENKHKLAAALNLNSQNLIFPKQTHTNCVMELSDIPKNAIDDTDALVTHKPGLCICVQTADCVPILLFDPIKKVVAAVHAGWRGTVGKIVEVTVQKMLTNYKSRPENIIAAIGPSISREIYEVGNEVVEAARKSIPDAEKTLRKNCSDNYHFDLWQANQQLLLACGLKTENIEILGECSFLETEKYYSARRDGLDTGRMVTGIMLKQ